MSLSNGSCDIYLVFVSCPFPSQFRCFCEVSSGRNLDKLSQAADMVAPGYPQTIRGHNVMIDDCAWQIKMHTNAESGHSLQVNCIIWQSPKQCKPNPDTPCKWIASPGRASSHANHRKNAESGHYLQVNRITWQNLKPCKTQYAY